MAGARASIFDVLLLSIIGVPIAAGLIGTVVPAFGYLPAIGSTSFSFEAWRSLFAYPGLGAAVRLSLTTGFLATIGSLVLAAGLCASLRNNMTVRRAEAMLFPLLAAPHAALAIGLAFVLAPSGWISRLVLPLLTGSHTPPDIGIVGDRYGIALIIGLMLKEVPYLLLVTLAALNQIPAGQQLGAARSLGYGHGVAWFKVVFPQIYPQIRLPILVVLIYSLSVVDMALVLAPSEPAPLSIVILRWFTSPDVTQYALASAAALLQLLLAGGAVLLWMLGEGVARGLGRLWVYSGGRGISGEPGLKILMALTAVALVLGLMALLSLGVWSFTWRWAYPAPLPTQWRCTHFVESNWTSHQNSQYPRYRDLLPRCRYLAFTRCHRQIR